jgi:hypothetical protein
MAEGRAAARPPGYDGRLAPSAPLTIDPAEPASMEMVRFGPGGRALVPVLVVKPGVRVCVGGFSADIDAVQWYEDLAVLALHMARCYSQAANDAALGAVAEAANGAVVGAAFGMTADAAVEAVAR